MRSRDENHKSKDEANRMRVQSDLTGTLDTLHRDLSTEEQTVQQRMNI